MALLRRSQPPAPGSQPLASTVSTALVASAALVSQRSFRRIQRNVGWQAEAWSYYDRCSTLRVAVGWLASALSRAQLFIGVEDPSSMDEPQRVDDAVAEQILYELGGGRGHTAFLRVMGTHMSVTGESYLTGWDDPGSKERLWKPLSADDVKIVGSKLAIDQGDGVKLLLSEGEFQMIRMWRPHPRWSAQSDSPVRSLGADLAELTGLTQHVLATIDSRLAGNGVLAVPESVTAPPVSGDQLHDDPVMAALIEAMTTPIQDRDSASAVVPLLLRVPDIAAGKIQHIKFGTDFDARVSDLRNQAIARIAAGVEIPTEIVSGLGEANHWSAWAIEESAVKIYINPLAALICDGLTSGFLRPALRALKHPDAEKLLIWYDTSDLTLRPDRSKESIELNGMGLVSDETTRRENGFSEKDKPTDAEYTRWVLMKLVTALPGLAPDALKQIDPNAKPVSIPVPPAAPTPRAIQENPFPETPAGQLPEGGPSKVGGPPPAGVPAPGAAPGRSGKKPGPPGAAGAQRTVEASMVASSAAQGTALAAAAEVVVLRALEIAGKRMLPNHLRGTMAAVPAWELHTRLPVGDPDRLLEGAFTLLEQVAPGMPCVAIACQAYARRLLETQSPHRQEVLSTILAACLEGLS